MLIGPVKNGCERREHSKSGLKYFADFSQLRSTSTIGIVFVDVNRPFQTNYNMPFLLQVYIDSPIILNGVCLRWKGYINLEKLDGVGGMKFDEDSARVRIIFFKEIPSFLNKGCDHRLTNYSINNKLMT